MDEVRQIVESYKAIREKTQYLKNYFEHIDACYKKCSDLLFRAAQIPRNTSWNDLNIINILEMGERQRTVFDEMSSLHNLTISKDVEELLNHVSEEITQIESDLGDIIKVNNTKMKEIERIKNLHKASWIEETDPWITDVKLKSVISKMYQTKEQNDGKVRSKLNMYTDKLKYTQDLFTGLINNFKKIQKSLFNNLLDSLNFKVNVNEDFERFFDAVSEEKKDNLSSKYVDAYNGIIETISKDLSSKNITVYKHLEPVKYGLVKARKGITGDWFLCFIVVTERKFLHLFDISPLYPSLSKYTQLLSKLKSNLNRGIVSIFDFKKNAISFVDERNLTCLSDEIKENIDKIIDSIYLTLSLSNKYIKIEKDKLIINIDDKNQSGFSSLFGMNIIRIKTFTLTHCYELFFGMTNKNESQIKETNEKIIEEVQMPSLVMNLNNDKIIKIDEENPWVE